VSDLRLEATTGLGLKEPVAEEWPEFSFSELADLSVWWLSCARGSEAALSKACEKHLGAGLPDRGRFAQAPSGARIIYAGDRQWFVTGQLPKIPAALSKTAAITDQSDGWLGVRISGSATRAVMEKLCGIDLHESAFPTGAAARTPIETMISLILCEDVAAGTYVILFQRSSARSFLDHVRHAAHSTSPRH